MRYALIIVMLVILSFSSAQIITSQDSLLMVEGLQKIDLTLADFNFLKDWADDTYLKNDYIVGAINNPYSFIELAEEINSINDIEGFDNLAYRFLNNNNIGLNYPDTISYELDNLLEVRELIDLIESYILIKNVHFKDMFTQITAEEMDILKTFANSTFNSQASSTMNVDSRVIDRIVRKIDWYIFYQPVIIEDKDYLSEKLVIKSLLDFFCHNIENIIWEERQVILDTDIGEIIVGSIYDDSHYIDNAIAVIDPAGNDHYTIINNNQNAYFHLDISGDDHYRSESSLFSANYGWSKAYDLSGDDYYSAKDQAFSAILGFQEFVDVEGNDHYKTESFSLASSLLGSAIIMDKAGNDVYVTAEYGQGFASTWGISLLLDQAGSDSYICGNSSFHAPLVPNDYRSMGQGMGFGLRPELGGGIGILLDKAGNDRYLGGVYAQGVGYWYALGLLIDNGGNDFYNAVYYPQGSGIHLAGGLLYDQAGEDSYYSKHGPGQGAGHDFGVGIFVDGSGNDHYSIEGGNGLGLTNSVGLFLDKEGDDRYENGTNSNYGYGKKARSAGSIGVFIDASGKDFYPYESMQDSLVWKQGTYGVGWDITPIQDSLIISDNIEQLSADIDSLATIETIFRYASEWEVGNVVDRVRRARQILINRDAETIEYIIEKKMSTRDTKEYRAIQYFFENSPDNQENLLRSLADKDSLANKNAISLIASLKIEEYIPQIIEFYETKQYLPTCISALASFKEDSLLSYIVEHIKSPNEKIRFGVANALKEVDSDLAREYIESMGDDNSFLIRSLVKEYLK